MNEKYNSAAAAKYLGLGPTTLDVWRSSKHYPQPAYYKVGNRVWYLKSELDAFIEQQTIRMVSM